MHNRRKITTTVCSKGALLLAVLLSITHLQANSVTINPDGVLLVDGKMIFPIGLTMGPPVDAQTPFTSEDQD